MALSSEQQGRSAAERFRHDHRLGLQPLGDLVALVEQTTGHDVAVVSAAPDDHGMIMRDPATGRAIVGIAASNRPMRQRSTLAHELGHLVFGDFAEDLAERSPAEVRADAFARHLLVPQEGVKEFLSTSPEVSDALLSDLVQRYLVSPAIAAIALRDAGCVPRPVADEWMKLRTPQIAARFGWSDHYAMLQDDSSRLRAPQGLLARAVAGFAEGIVSAQVIATLRGVSPEQVIEELEAAGVVPKVHNVADFELEQLPEVTVDLSALEDEG